MGGHAFHRKRVPPPNRLRHASSTPPQGGSEIQQPRASRQRSLGSKMFTRPGSWNDTGTVFSTSARRFQIGSSYEATRRFRREAARRIREIGLKNGETANRAALSRTIKMSWRRSPPPGFRLAISRRANLSSSSESLLIVVSLKDFVIFMSLIFPIWRSTALRISCFIHHCLV